jgi:hypothetical protein
MQRIPDHADASGLFPVVKECMSRCHHMTVMMLYIPDVRMRANQIRLLHDCAIVYTLMATMLSRGNAFARKFARFCACVCEEVCGNECARFPDPESHRCAQVCLHCARECRRFALK